MELRKSLVGETGSVNPSENGNASATGTYKNLILQRLKQDVVSRLNLRRVNFEMGHEIEYPGKPIDHLFFVEEGMASLTTTFQDGTQVEVGMFGYESVIGVSALMGTKQSLNRIYTQISGYGYSCTTEAASREFQMCGLFQKLTLRYVQAQLVQAMQSAGCNAKHEVDQRLARWLLLCADRAHSNTFKMSQEYLADMLGSSRPTVTVAAGNLKAKGLIEYTRGTIHIPDSKRLEKVACECYHVIKDHLGNYAEFDTRDVA
jgi:CRP-like cAMP-binding protein